MKYKKSPYWVPPLESTLSKLSPKGTSMQLSEWSIHLIDGREEGVNIWVNFSWR